MSFAPTATAVLNYWVRILAALEKKINRQSYDTWLKPTRFSHIAGDTLFVRIPSTEFQHIGDRYADLIQEAIENLGLEIETVVADRRAIEQSSKGGLGKWKQQSLLAGEWRATEGPLNTGNTSRRQETRDS